MRSRPAPDPTLMCNLANATLCLGRQQEALAIALDAVRVAPDNSLPHRTLANTLPYTAGVTGARLLASARACAATLPRGPAPVFRNAPDPDRRLRVGLLSGMLKTHPVAWLTIAGFEALDPARFTLVGLADTMPGDALSRRFRAVAAEWVEIGALDDAALATAARAAAIDVVIDLGGYGDLGRMAACAYRLAPVQVKWVGMQNHTTGLPEMDWFITDPRETPPALAHTYTERLLALPDGYVCYSPPADAPGVAALPAHRSGHVSFGCFTNLAKVTPIVVATWAAVLSRVPGSRLVVKSHAFADAVTAAGLPPPSPRKVSAPERLELRGPSPHRALLAEYGDIDIVLDPFPYSGGLTTCEALWMGVPTVTLPGETFASRHSFSHLGNVGLADWAAGGRFRLYRSGGGEGADLMPWRRCAPDCARGCAPARFATRPASAPIWAPRCATPGGNGARRGAEQAAPRWAPDGRSYPPLIAVRMNTSAPGASAVCRVARSPATKILMWRRMRGVVSQSRSRIPGQLASSASMASAIVAADS